MKRDTPKNPVIFTKNDRKILKGGLEKINSKPGKLEMIIDKFLCTLIFRPDQHSGILRNSWPLKQFICTLENSIYKDNLDDFNRITEINSLDFNKTPRKRKRDPGL